jgi:hypothetical protein
VSTSKFRGDNVKTSQPTFPDVEVKQLVEMDRATMLDKPEGYSGALMGIPVRRRSLRATGRAGKRHFNVQDKIAEGN